MCVSGSAPAPDTERNRHEVQDVGYWVLLAARRTPAVLYDHDDNDAMPNSISCLSS